MAPYSSAVEDPSQASSLTKKLRLACDVCHSTKTRCCGNIPCARCLRCGTRCVYSQSNRAGRPKGTRNKKSIDNSKPEGNHRDSTSPQRQEHESRKQEPQESQQPVPSRNALNRSSSYGSEPGNALPKATSSLSSFAGPSLSPSLGHAQMHSQQQEHVNNMAFDFNPTSNFSGQSTNALYPSLPSQGHLTFPMGPDDMNIDAMDIQAVIDLAFDLDDLQRDCNISDKLGISRHDTNASRTSMTKIPRDFLPPSSEHDETAHSNSLQAHSESLSQTSTNSHSNGHSSGRSGSPEIPQSRDSYDSSISMAAAKNAQLIVLSEPVFPDDNISLAELKCQCLQRHVQFLGHSQELLQGFDQLPLDVVLNGVDQGLKVWDLCLQCRMCQQDRNREVLLLSVTSIRTAARILQKASRRIFKQSHFDDGVHHSGNSVSCAEGQSQSRQARFTFGSYEIKGEESWLVLGVILTRMLARIQGVLVSFKQSLDSPSSRKADNNGGDYSSDYLHKLLEGLQANIHALSAGLMGGI